MILPGCHHFLSGSLGLHAFFQNISTAGGFNRSSLLETLDMRYDCLVAFQTVAALLELCICRLPIQPCAIRTSLFKSSRLSVAGDLHLLRSVRLAWHFPRMLNGQTAGEGVLDNM